MSAFEVPIVRIRAIEEIPGADLIELAVVGDYRSVVRKGQYGVGSYAAYIPEASLVPAAVLDVLGLTGKLAGSDHNRVKAAKFRGCLSQGILYPVDKVEDGGAFIVVPTEDGIGAMHPVAEGENVAAALGITKWEPAIPACMNGVVYYAGQALTVPFDIENFKKYPDILVPGEEVVFTEKLHGTFCGVGVLPAEHYGPNHIDGKFVVFSKGLGSNGMCFKDVVENENNIYIKTLRETGVIDRLHHIAGDNRASPIFFLGEVFGKGVQDLEYGVPPAFRIFAVVTGFRGYQRYEDWNTVEELAIRLGINTVPVLYKGPFSYDVMMTYTSGMETVTGKGVHLREGIVVTPTTERVDHRIGRVILKSVSEAYLLRKGNATEFQ